MNTNNEKKTSDEVFETSIPPQSNPVKCLYYFCEEETDNLWCSSYHQELYNRDIENLNHAFIANEHVKDSVDYGSFRELIYRNTYNVQMAEYYFNPFNL